MRKLLVASQKSGVGKTTASVNLAASAALAGGRALLIEADPLGNVSSALSLAEHPGRALLRDLGVPLPGVLTPGVLPGLDVLSPYEAGGCSDEALGQLLSLAGTEPVLQQYSCLIVDSPPFLGASPGLLLSSCDELLVVMRAEAHAHRTLPALLEMARRGRPSGQPIRLRGILLTLDEGEPPGSRWERELRGRLGTRILPEVIPHDAAVAEAAASARITVSQSPPSTAATIYRSLAESLDLTSSTPASSHPLPAGEVLTEAARAAIEPARPAPPVAPSRLSAQGGARRPATPPRPPSRRVPAVQEPQHSDSGFEMFEEPPLPEAAQPTPGPVAPGFPVATGLMWMGAAIAAGVALRFAPLPDVALPGLVGLAVAGIVVFLLQAMSQEQGQEAAATPVQPPSSPTLPRPEPRSAVSRRLSGIRRRLGSRRP